MIALLALFSTLFVTSQARAQPPVSSDEARWLRNVRQLTTAEMGLERTGEAYFSPDGKRICFQAYPRAAGKPEYQIYVMNVDGTDLRMVSTGKGACTCAYFHPDGRRMLFASNHLDPSPAPKPPEEVSGAAQKSGMRNYSWSFFPGMDIFEYNLADSAKTPDGDGALAGVAPEQLKRLTDAGGYDAEGSYSPDGKRIVFTSMRDGDQEIYLMDADGGNARRVTKHAGYDGGPFFSPDGKRIVYRSDRKGDGNMAIFTNNLEGTDEQALTDDSVLHWCPFWHPSGKWLNFTRADHGSGDSPKRPNYDLYLLNVEDKRMLRITTDESFDGLPAFSADGRQMMWTSKRGGLPNAQVFIADFIGLTPAGDLVEPATAK